MKNNLDRDLTRSLEEGLPDPSPLNAGALHRHEAEIHRAEEAASRKLAAAGFLSQRAYRAASVAVTVALVLILLWGVTDLPVFGRESNPVENEVAGRYLEAGLREGGATNLVSNMILDYRAFDTLGESNVLFTASCAVFLLLRRTKEAAPSPAPSAPPPADPILQAGVSLLFPFLLLCGAYIILSGHLGPGGGFSGGTVLGAALILARVSFPPEKGLVLSEGGCRKLIFAALTFYGVSKAWSFFTGANGLPFPITAGTPGAILSAGLILPLNIAVGLVVCCTMYGFFALFEKGAF